MKKWLAVMLSMMMLVGLQAQVIAYGAPVSVTPGKLPYALQKPDYLKDFLKMYKDLTANLDPAVFKSRAGDDPRRVAGFSAMGVRLYAMTGNKVYLNNAKIAWDSLMQVFATSITTSNGFFLNEPLLIAYEGLKQQNLLSPGDEAIVMQAVKNNNWGQEGDDNQALNRTAGMLWSLKLFPNDPDAASWKQHADEIWNYWYSIKDLTENASHYSVIGVSAVIRIAKLTGREDDLKDPQIRKVFERYRDQISPMGAVPEYGDDYFTDVKEYPFIFEYAAKLYNDPTYLEAAWKVYRFYQNNYPYQIAGFDANVWTLFNNQFVVDILTLDTLQQEPQFNNGGSKILMRNERGSTAAAYDKMILAPSRLPGSPFVMSILNGQGSHAHLNRIGAIQYFEAGGEPLYHGMARNNKGATDSNVVAMMPGDSAEQFPYGNKSFLPQVWYHEQIPAQMLITDETVNNTVTFGPLNLRIAPTNSDMDFIIDNLRLEGPAGVKMIDDFESLDKWIRNDNPYSLTNDSTQGNHALKIHATPSANKFYTAWGWDYNDPNAQKPGYDTSFSLNDYTVIKYDWKYVAPAPVTFAYLFRMIVGTNTGIDTLPGDINNVPLVQHARTEDRNGDSFGEYQLDEYFTYDSTLTRRTVLTREGVMVVQDAVAPGATAAGYVAGPIWQTYSLANQGDNWFDSPEENRIWTLPDGTNSPKKNLLVYFNKADGRSFGVNPNVAVTNNPTPANTVYAKQPIQPGKPITFVTVLIPHLPGVSPQDLASLISVQQGENGTSKVTVAFPGDALNKLYITLNGNGEGWNVVRSGDMNADGQITQEDLTLAAAAYKKTAKDSDWASVQNADIDGDGSIGVFDLAFISKHITDGGGGQK